MNAWSAPPTSFTTGAIVQVSLHAFIWHLLCISNAERSLQLQRRSKFVFCNTKLWCLPTNKLALTVTSNGRGKKKRAKPKCFLIGPLGDRAKVQHWLSRYAVKRETFTMATSVSAKTYTVETFTQRDGKICKPVHREQNTLVLMRLHSRLTSILLMLLPGEIYATKRFYTSF